MFSGKAKKIFERDGNKCWLCNKEIHYTDNRKLSASIDHVVPRKFGGISGLENLRLAHQYCNSIREYKYPNTMCFTMEQIEKYTNRNAVTGQLSKSAMKAVRQIERTSI